MTPSVCPHCRRRLGRQRRQEEVVECNGANANGQLHEMGSGDVAACMLLKGANSLQLISNAKRCMALGDRGF